MKQEISLTRVARSAALMSLMFFACIASVRAQIAQNGDYKLEQAVIASGGGTSNDTSGNVFSLTGTIGQAIAGTSSTNSPYTIKGGFFTAGNLAPTAAGVTVSGRIMTSAGKGIRSVLITMTDSSGAIRTTVSTVFGRFSFEDVPAGETYILNVTGKRFTFIQPVQIYSIMADIDDIVFIGESVGLQNP